MSSRFIRRVIFSYLVVHEAGPLVFLLAIIHTAGELQSSHLARMLVGQVQVVTGELNTARRLALDEEGVVVACRIPAIVNF